MNNAKLQLEVVSPTTIKCGYAYWFSLDTKLVGKVKALLEENEKLKEHKYFTRQDALDEALDRIDKAMVCITKREWVNCEDCVNQVYDILRGEENENN